MALAYLVRKSIITAGVIVKVRGEAIEAGEIPAAQADRVIVYDDGGSTPVLASQVPK